MDGECPFSDQDLGSGQYRNGASCSGIQPETSHENIGYPCTDEGNEGLSKALGVSCRPCRAPIRHSLLLYRIRFPTLCHRQIHSAFLHGLGHKQTDGFLQAMVANDCQRALGVRGPPTPGLPYGKLCKCRILDLRGIRSNKVGAGRLYFSSLHKAVIPSLFMEQLVRVAKQTFSVWL